MEWIESTIWLAFWVGIVSAISLPLGALTIRVWQPSARTIAWLMAFGAGALLFALTIDLFAPAIASGLYWQVSLGAVIGSLVYLFLNQHLNDWGGFLRKTGTTLQFMQQRHKRRQLSFLTSINRLAFLKHLPEEDKLRLLSYIEIETYRAQKVIYQQGDLHDAFYLIHSGVVRLQDPQRQLKTFMELETYDVFGRMAFFTRQPNATQAVVKETAEVWKISREAFNQFLESSPAGLAAFKAYYAEAQIDYAPALPVASPFNAEMLHYLMQRHQMSQYQAEQHLQTIQQSIQHRHQLGQIARQAPTKGLSVALFEKQIGLLPVESALFQLLHTLPASAKKVLASSFEYRVRQQGECLYKNHSLGAFWFLLDYGEIELFLPQEKFAEPVHLGPGRFFGSRAFFLGGSRVSTALAKTQVGYWQISRQSFEALFASFPEMGQALQGYFRSETVKNYLMKDQKLSPLETQQWLKSIRMGRKPYRLPDLVAKNHPVRPSVAPYLAIWLGIFLDGIPESLTIGAHLASQGAISLSLLVGLFLSNYPEALSSSASMRAQGFSYQRIFWSWASLTLLTGLGAALGSFYFSSATATEIAIISGIAAGAMLTVIAETMLPESFAKAGSVVGLVTLLGFLTALMFKALDP